MNKKEDIMEPTFVARDGMLADKEYVTWLSELKQRFQSSQAKAAVRVNTAMLEYYWSLGRDIVKKKADSKWGSGFFNQLSDDMRSMFPNETGFSVTNLKYMKRWYSFYNEQVVIRQQAADELEKPINQRPIDGEQGGKARAEYGKGVLKRVSERLTERLGRGWSVDTLENARNFYNIYAKSEPVVRKFNPPKSKPVVRKFRTKIVTAGYEIKIAEFKEKEGEV